MSLSPDFKRGDPLSHETVNQIIRRLEPVAPRGGAGLDVRMGRHGQVQLGLREPVRFVGVASGAITARSGSTWGTGTVTRYQFDPVSGTDSTTGVNYSVVNPSATTMSSGNGINSGQYCWVQEDDDGNLVVTPLECA